MKDVRNAHPKTKIDNREGEYNILLLSLLVAGLV